MLNLESGDRIELFYEDSPATTIRATVARLLTDWDEGMGIELKSMLLVGSRSLWISRATGTPNKLYCFARIPNIG
jgi:hypothetical protein